MLFFQRYVGKTREFSAPEGEIFDFCHEIVLVGSSFDVEQGEHNEEVIGCDGAHPGMSDVTVIATVIMSLFVMIQLWLKL